MGWSKLGIILKNDFQVGNQTKIKNRNLEIGILVDIILKNIQVSNHTKTIESRYNSFSLHAKKNFSLKVLKNYNSICSKQSNEYQRFNLMSIKDSWGLKSMSLL